MNSAIEWWNRPDVKALAVRVLAQLRKWDESDAPVKGRYMLASFEEAGDIFGPPPDHCLPSPIDSPFGIMAGEIYGVHIIVRYTTLLGRV
ncbi:hypothetical protein LCGC14_0552450 [marine sediment metagenome]|uniref:Uncharacterized protein n=1 Tax=marine sediment metagenome TaxID=412755 RepID=A0A0F9S859_9ZZZZ